MKHFVWLSFYLKNNQKVNEIENSSSSESDIFFSANDEKIIDYI